MAKKREAKSKRGFPKAKCNRQCPAGSKVSQFSTLKGDREYCQPESIKKQLKNEKELIDPEWESEKEPNPDYQNQKIHEKFSKNKDCYSKTSKKLAEETFGIVKQKGCIFIDKKDSMVLASKKDRIIDIKDYKDCEPTGIRHSSGSYQIEYLFESKDKKNATLIDPNNYDNNKDKFNKSCKCKDFNDPILLSSEKHDLYIMPNNTYSYNPKEYLEMRRHEFSPIQEYQDLKKLSKNELAKISKISLSKNKDEHINSIMHDIREKREREYMQNKYNVK